MKKSEWYDLLKHPKWQKKRLEILESANFECDDCGSQEKTLHVHHTYYEYGKKPWEYDNLSLKCLCEDCHKRHHELLDALTKKVKELDYADQEVIYGYVCATELHSLPMIKLDVKSYEFAQGVADCWGVKPENVIAELKDGQIDGWNLDLLRKKSTQKG